jgi:hypothetical protein
MLSTEIGRVDCSIAGYHGNTQANGILFIRLHGIKARTITLDRSPNNSAITRRKHARRGCTKIEIKGTRLDSLRDQNAVVGYTRRKEKREQGITNE